MSVLDVWNEALSAAGARGRLGSTSERSPEQEVCETWYNSVRNTVQAAAWWPECRAISRLALLATASPPWNDGQPEPGFAYAYALPADYLHPWHLTDYTRFSISYSVTLERQVLSSNTEYATLVYARENENDVLWSPDHRMAVVYGLAAHISAPLTGKNSTMQRTFQLADNILKEAQARMAQTVEPPPRSAVPWLVARGYQNAAQSTRYFYPHGSLFQAGVVTGAS